jgi:hypothetical protein
VENEFPKKKDVPQFLLRVGKELLLVDELEFRFILKAYFSQPRPDC